MSSTTFFLTCLFIVSTLVATFAIGSALGQLFGTALFFTLLALFALAMMVKS
jgi:hypothetical protein